MKPTFKSGVALAGLCAASVMLNAANAGQLPANMRVNATIVSGCTQVSSTQLPLGVYDTVNDTAERTATFEVVCALNHPFSLNIDRRTNVGVVSAPRAGLTTSNSLHALEGPTGERLGFVLDIEGPVNQPANTQPRERVQAADTAIPFDYPTAVSTVPGNGNNSRFIFTGFIPGGQALVSGVYEGNVGYVVDF